MLILRLVLLNLLCVIALDYFFGFDRVVGSLLVGMVMIVVMLFSLMFFGLCFWIYGYVIWVVLC